MLFFVELLQMEQGVAVARVERAHLRQGFDGAVDEARVAVVETEAEQDVRVLNLGQPRTLQ